MEAHLSRRGPCPTVALGERARRGRRQRSERYLDAKSYGIGAGLIPGRSPCDGTLVAVAAGEVVGELRVEPSWFGYGEIGMMVTADRRGRGVGTALVPAAVEWARARGLHKLTPISAIGETSQAATHLSSSRLPRVD